MKQRAGQQGGSWSWGQEDTGQVELGSLWDAVDFGVRRLNKTAPLPGRCRIQDWLHMCAAQCEGKTWGPSFKFMKGFETVTGLL